MIREEMLWILKEQLKKDPKDFERETSPYGSRTDTATSIVTTGHKHTRSYGEAPYLGSRKEAYSNDEK